MNDEQPVLTPGGLRACVVSRVPRLFVGSFFIVCTHALLGWAVRASIAYSQQQETRTASLVFVPTTVNTAMPLLLLLPQTRKIRRKSQRARGEPGAKFFRRGALLDSPTAMSGASFPRRLVVHAGSLRRQSNDCVGYQIIIHATDILRTWLSKQTRSA